MQDEWIISNQDAEIACNFLEIMINKEIKVGGIELKDLEALKNVHAALMWADRIEIEGE